MAVKHRLPRRPGWRPDLAAVLSLALAVFSCSDDTFPLDLDETPLHPVDTATVLARSKTYQVPPMFGGLTTLYLGSHRGYSIPMILMAAPDLSILRDTTIALDSARMELAVDTTIGSLTEGTELFLGYFPADSSFGEPTTNYLNVSDWLPLDYDSLEGVITSDSSGRFLRFSIDTALVRSWSDTTVGEPLFVIRPAVGWEGHAGFSSAEEAGKGPRLLVSYHTATMDTARSFPISADLSIIAPPEGGAWLRDSTRIWVGTAAGLRTLLDFDLAKPIRTTEGAVVLKARITFGADSLSSSISGTPVRVRAYALSDAVEDWSHGHLLDSDTLAIGTGSGSVSSEGSLSGGSLVLDVTSIVQAWVANPEKNFGLKLIPSEMPSLFDHAAFHGSSEEIYVPRLDILYEVP